MSRLTNSPRIISRLLSTSKMPAFTLYGALASSNTARVRLTLAEGGFTDYDLVVVNLQKGEQKSKEHMKRHPWGKIPAITTADGFTLYESRAICKYLARKYSFPLLPPTSNIEAMASFDQAESTETLYFADPAGKIIFEKFAKKIMGLPPNETAITDALRSLESFFDVAEGLLSNKNNNNNVNEQYMAGPEFSLVDIFYIPIIQRLFAAGYGQELIGTRPNVSNWWNRCVNRPAVSKLLAADKEAMAMAAMSAGAGAGAATGGPGAAATAAAGGK